MQARTWLSLLALSACGGPLTDPPDEGVPPQQQPAPGSIDVAGSRWASATALPSIASSEPPAALTASANLASSTPVPDFVNVVPTSNFAGLYRATSGHR